MRALGVEGPVRGILVGTRSNGMRCGVPTGWRGRQQHGSSSIAAEEPRMRQAVGETWLLVSAARAG